MTTPLNKEEFIKLYNEFITQHNLNPLQVHTAFGGSMLMLGLRTHTNDIDLTVSLDVWKQFPQPASILNDCTLIKKITDKIDIHLVQMVTPNTDIITEHGVRYRNAKQTLENKLLLNRPKDKEDIRLLLEAYPDILKRPKMVYEYN